MKKKGEGEEKRGEKPLIFTPHHHDHHSYNP